MYKVFGGGGTVESEARLEEMDIWGYAIEWCGLVLVPSSHHLSLPSSGHDVKGFPQPFTFLNAESSETGEVRQSWSSEITPFPH